MEEQMEKDVHAASLQGQLSQANRTGFEDGHGMSQVDQVPGKLVEVKAGTRSSDNDIERELEVFWQKVKGTLALLTYLKSMEGMTEVPNLAHVLSGIGQEEEARNIDENDMQLSDWSADVDLSVCGNSDEENSIGVSKRNELFDGYNGAYVRDMLKSVQVVTDLMRVLVKWIIMAENETAVEKEKVCLGKEEIRKKVLQLDILSAKVKEMENFALRTTSILDEMQRQVKDLVHEISIQSHRAADNEQELSRVKQEFESLRLHVRILMTVRETLLSPERQFLTMEKLSERLISMTTRLEDEKIQKEAEVQKLMAANVKLLARLDKKEAQLVAMNEQCKAMALNTSGV